MAARDFPALAARLTAGNGPTPADCRTAISRSYYAVFDLAAEHLRGMGFPIGKGAAAHGETQKCLANSGEPTVAAPAPDLGDLHASRNRADYQLDKTDVEKLANARAVVGLAAASTTTPDAAFAGPQRPQLLAAIQKWRRDNGYP